MEPGYYSPNITRNDNDYTESQWVQVKASFRSRRRWGVKTVRIVDYAAGHVARRKPWLRRIYGVAIPVMAVTWFASLLMFSLTALVTIALTACIVNYRSL
jgi:hypothetical protein